MIPVTGNTIEVAFSHQRSFGKLVATAFFGIFNPTLELLDYTSTFRKQDGQTLTNVVNGGEVFQFTTKFVVVAFQSFSLLFQVSVQFFFFRESYAINTLEHFTAAIATPVSTGSRGQFNCIAFNTTSGIKMRASAQIGEVTLFVEADYCIFRQVVDEFNFVGFFQFFHKFDCFCTRKFKAFQFEFFFANFTHFAFESSQIFRSKRSRSIKVIVEAVVDARTDCQLNFRMQTFHSLRQYMGASMPISFAIFFIFKSVQFFFRHFKSLLYKFHNQHCERKIKNSNPSQKGRSYPRFHPN